MQFFSTPFFLLVSGLLVIVSLPTSLRARKIFITFASCLFYGFESYRYLLLLFCICGIDYYAAHRISLSQNERKRRFWLTTSILSNVATLIYFKYFVFFWSAFSTIKLPNTLTNILLPAGISFYTLKSLSYTIDVFRKKIQPTKSWLDYAMYVTFFPDLIAGPIVRASSFLPQLQRHTKLNTHLFSSGATLFIIGMTKKRFFADRIAIYADQIFQDPGTYGTGTLWLGAIAYSFQLYCDFSGYSDLAVGTARMFGYDLPENFHMPFLSRNISVFWHRWHITLGAWMRDYLYIPLGGNKKGKFRTYINLSTVMLIGGLWHGANWTFVFFGVLNGFFLFLHRLWSSTFTQLRIPKLLGISLTFICFTLSLVFFRAVDLQTAFLYLRRLFIPSFGAIYVSYPILALFFAIALAHWIGVLFDKHTRHPGHNLSRALDLFGLQLEELPLAGVNLKMQKITVMGTWLLTIWAITFLFFGSPQISPFIYFRF